MALRIAPGLPPGVYRGLGPLVRGVGPWLPVVGRNVRANMQALGVYTPARRRAYFAAVGRHFEGTLRCLACTDARRRSALLPIALDRFPLGSALQRCVADGSLAGAILAGPHFCDYLLALVAMNQHVPLTVLLRPSKSARQQDAKQRWYSASGVEWVEQAEGDATMGRLGPLIDGLRRHRTLFVTPDLPQKSGAGVAVRFFNREIWLPAGIGWLALRTRAPLYFLSVQQVGSEYQLEVGKRFEPEVSRGRDERRAAVARIMQWYADALVSFLQADPGQWYFWGDKRWTRTIQADERYARILPEAESETGTRASAKVATS